jgi:hypothetical protein
VASHQVVLQRLVKEQRQPGLMIQQHLGLDLHLLLLLLLLLLLGPALALHQQPLAPQQLAPLLLLLQLARLPLACGALLLVACAAPASARRLVPSHACTAAVHLLPSCDPAVQHLAGTRSTAPEGAHVALQPCEGGHVGGLACQVAHPLLLLLAPLPLQVHTRQALVPHSRLQGWAPCKGAAQLQG